MREDEGPTGTWYDCALAAAQRWERFFKQATPEEAEQALARLGERAAPSTATHALDIRDI